MWDVIDKDKNNSSYLPINFPSVVPPIMKNILAKADSGSLLHYFKNDNKCVLREKTQQRIRFEIS